MTYQTKKIKIIKLCCQFWDLLKKTQAQLVGTILRKETHISQFFIDHLLAVISLLIETQD
jgi:hypothetical protein